MIGTHVLHTVSSCCVCTDKCVYVARQWLQVGGFQLGQSLPVLSTPRKPTVAALAMGALAVGTGLRLSISFLKWTVELGRGGLRGERWERRALVWARTEQPNQTPAPREDVQSLGSSGRMVY